MNGAQKRTWLTFWISLVTLLVCGVVLWYAWVNEIVLIDFERPIRIPLLSIPAIIPLILIVFIELRYHKRDFDERDKEIGCKSVYAGYVAALVFMLAAGIFLVTIVKPMDTTTNIYIWMRFAFLLYLASFVSFLATSIASLIQYGGRLKGHP
jgi:hypothetical protein